jgi:AcrR family transcriptional regulator
MVRPRDDEKHKAILTAALNVFAERGIASTPTSAISKAAGVAEGTLFTYFGTKDELINELYKSLKLELAEALLKDLPEGEDCRLTLHHVWRAFVSWGATNGLKNKVLLQLKASEKLTEESLRVGSEPFFIIEQKINQAIAKKEIRDYSCDFMAAVMAGVAEATMAFISAQKISGNDQIDFCEQGFEVLWNGIALPA